MRKRRSFIVLLPGFIAISLARLLHPLAGGSGIAPVAMRTYAGSSVRDRVVFSKKITRRSFLTGLLGVMLAATGCSAASRWGLPTSLPQPPEGRQTLVSEPNSTCASSGLAQPGWYLALILPAGA